MPHSHTAYQYRKVPAPEVPALEADGWQACATMAGGLVRLRRPIAEPSGDDVALEPDDVFIDLSDGFEASVR